MSAAVLSADPARPTPGEVTRARGSRPRGRWTGWAGVLVLVSVVFVLVGWRANGGTWVRVETPSMGTTAPVGTLLWITPVPAASLRVGDLVTFRPPGSSGPTYSHEIRAIHPDGTFSTQGRVTAPDPWRIGSEDIVGKAVLRMPGVGWLVLAGPMLMLGALMVGVLAGRLRDREMRLPAAVVGAAVVLAIAVVHYQPLTRAEQISFAPEGEGARATYVSTGLVPVRITAPGSPSVVLADGEVGSVLAVHGDDVPSGERFSVAITPALPRSWWAVLVGCCFVPAVLTSLRRRRLDRPEAGPVPGPGADPAAP